jgi:hypothetical protein
LPDDGSLSMPPDDPDAGATRTDAGRSMTDASLARDVSSVTDRGAVVDAASPPPTSDAYGRGRVRALAQ